MIESYHFGRITIDGQTYRSDVILYPDRVDSQWWRKEGHKLQLADIQPLLEARPRWLVIGTGAYGLMKVTPEVIEAAEAAGIQLVSERTKRACERYNALCQQSEDVIAALHLTC